MRGLLAVLALCAVAAVLPASASAATWKGKTKQGRKAVVVTDDANGFVSRAKIGWKATCGDGAYTSRTTFVPPFDVSTATSFEDTGSYSAHPDGYRAWTTTTVSGRYFPRVDRWRGRLDVKVRVRKNGKLVDTCRLTKLKWSVGRD
jgi:hypothetical protein